MKWSAALVVATFTALGWWFFSTSDVAAPAVPEVEAPADVAAAPHAALPRSGFCPGLPLPRFRLARSPGAFELVLADGGVVEGRLLITEKEGARPAGAAASYLLARSQAATFDLDGAIASLEHFLSAHDDVATRAWKARLEVARDIQRSYRHATSGPVTVWSPGTDADTYRLARAQQFELWLVEAARSLGRQPPSEVHAVIYPSRSELLAVSCAPTWGGGLYDGTVRLVSDFKLDRTARHELMHAAQASVIPIWLAEGLAQRFEPAPPSRHGWTLVQAGTWIPFSSLEASLGEFDGRDSSLAYAQSHAMAGILAACAPDGLRLAHERASTGLSGDLFKTVCGQSLTGQRLLEHMRAALEDAGVRAPAPATASESPPGR